MTQTQPEGRLAGAWQADPANCRITFRVRKLGVIPVSGRLPVTAVAAQVGPDGAFGGLSARLDARGFETGHGQRDADVRGENYLDAERYPEITFAADRAEPAGEGWLLPGELTVRDLTRPQPLTVQPVENGEATDRLRFRASAVVDRRRYGVTRLPGVIGRRLRVDLDITLVRTGT